MRSFLFIIAAVAAVYFPVVGFEFINLDDAQLLYDNYLIRTFSPKIFVTYDPELYVPLTLLSFQIEHLLFGLNPSIYHITNLVLHAANACLIFSIFRRWFSWRLALVGGLLFAVHPLHTEAAVWVSARKDLLSGFFFLWGLLLYLRSSRFAVLAFVCALLAKVTAITLLPVLFLIDWKYDRWSLRDKWQYIALAIIFAAIAVGGKSDNLSALSIMDYALLASKSMVFYLQKLIVPTDLSILYPWTESISILSLDFALPVLLVGIIGLLLWYAYTSDKSLFFGLSFFLLTLAPSLLTFSKMGDVYFASDRYAYIPSVGIIFLFVTLLDRSQIRNNLVTFFSIGLIGVFGFSAHHRALAWETTESLLLDTLEVYPNAHLAHGNLGHRYIELGRVDDAVYHLQQNLTLKPNDFIAHNNLGFIRMGQGNNDTALAHFQASMETNNGYAPTHVNVGVWHARKGNYFVAEEALKNAIVLDPYLSSAYYNLAGVYLKGDELEKAREYYQKTLEIEPGHRLAIKQLQKL